MLAVEPIGRYFSLAVQDERPADSCQDLSNDDPCERAVDEQSEGNTDDAKYASDDDADSGAVSINDVGSGKGEDGMHEDKKESAEVDNSWGLVIDFSEILSDGIQGSQ